MIPTPRLSHLSAEDFDLVYEPAEDTFILLDALEQDAEDLRTGIENKVTFLLSTPITTQLYVLRQIPLNPINASFALPFHSRLAHAIDVILFNPPYVPTIISEVSEAQDIKGIAGSWAGGSDGMQVTNRFLEMVADLLSPRGRFYLVAVKENNIPEIQHRMLNTYGLKSTIVLSRRAGREHLSVIRFTRMSSS
ncbi:S-adenosylmethionine-dependent methyltransferase [Paramarasmius palmivorus]|uniref:S-adenosylmethionine-dependent methyltransferase n=1 Tax=Paramarasmius palmivorus TaxID=297713 RepID=A0AAW0E635_9AGAR